MLPQKLGLDVIVEKSTGNLVTVEVNGENSGYEGLTLLGEDLFSKIVTIIGNTLQGQRVLVHPNFTDLEPPLESFRGAAKRLREEFGVRLVFSPSLEKQISKEEFEDRLGSSLDEFAGLIGFGEYLSGDSELERRMINAPSVELVACDKLLQHELLKEVPGLNMPQTWLLREGFFLNILDELQRIHGRWFIQKERHGSQGYDITIIDAENTSAIWSTDLLIGSTRYMGKLLVKLHPKRRSAVGAFETVLGWLSVKSLSLLYKLDQGTANKLARLTLEIAGGLFQRFVETQPVIYQKTGQPHFGRARIIWFGEYVGGYWALSANPISDTNPTNAVVNFSRSGISQQFTPEEVKMFRKYAEEVVPLVLQRLSPYNGRTGEYKGIEERLIREAILKRPTDVVSQQQR